MIVIVTIVDVLGVLTVAIVDAMSIEEVAVATSAVTARMTLVQEVTVMIALVDGLMIVARTVARDAVALTVPRRRLWTQRVKSATSMDILQRTAGGAMVTMMTLMIEVPKVTRAQTMLRMALTRTGTRIRVLLITSLVS
jgi:hypothetical protein